MNNFTIGLYLSGMLLVALVVLYMDGIVELGPDWPVLFVTWAVVWVWADRDYPHM